MLDTEPGLFSLDGGGGGRLVTAVGSLKTGRVTAVAGVCILVAGVDVVGTCLGVFATRLSFIPWPISHWGALVCLTAAVLGFTAALEDVTPAVVLTTGFSTNLRSLATFTRSLSTARICGRVPFPS